MIIYQPSKDLIFDEFDEMEYYWANFQLDLDAEREDEYGNTK